MKIGKTLFAIPFFVVSFTAHANSVCSDLYKSYQKNYEEACKSDMITYEVCVKKIPAKDTFLNHLSSKQGISCDQISGDHIEKYSSAQAMSDYFFNKLLEMTDKRRQAELKGDSWTAYKSTREEANYDNQVDFYGKEALSAIATELQQKAPQRTDESGSGVVASGNTDDRFPSTDNY